MARPSIPGLDVIEESQLRSVAPSTRPNFTMGGGAPTPPRPNTAVATRPYQPNFTMGGAAPQPSASARQPFDFESPARKPSMTSRMNDFADRVNASSTSQRGAVSGVTQTVASRVRSAGEAYKGLTGAASNAASAVANNPGLRLAGRGLGFAGAAGSALDTAEAVQQGDGAGALRSGLNTLAGGAMVAGGPAAALVGGAYSAGDLIGSGINKGIRAAGGEDMLIDKVGGYVNRVANVFGGGVDPTAVQRADNFIRSSPGTPAAPAAAPAGAQADYSNEGRNRPMPAAPAPAAPGVITRNGNSYSGPAGLKAGADIINPDGSIRSGAGVTSMEPGYGAGLKAELAGLQAERAQREASAPGPQMFGIRDTATEERNAKMGGDSRIRDMVRAGMSVRQAGAFVNQEAQQAQQKEIADAQLAVQSQGQGQGLRIAEMNNATSRENNATSNATARDNNATSNATSIRGQDITAETGRAASRSAAAKAALEQANKDRDFAAGREDAGQSQRNARETQVQKNLESMFTRTSSDGGSVVDQAAVQDARQGLDRSVVRLGGKSLADLDSSQQTQLLTANQLLKTMRENSGQLFWEPDALKTIDPLDLVGLQVDPKTGNRAITRQDSKARGQVIPGRFFDTEEGNRIRAFGTPTNRYDILQQQ